MDRFGVMELDMFASRFNSVANLYISKNYDPFAFVHNGFDWKWRQIVQELGFKKIYANPPFHNCHLLIDFVEALGQENSDCRIFACLPNYKPSVFWVRKMRKLVCSPPLRWKSTERVFQSSFVAPEKKNKMVLKIPP